MWTSGYRSTARSRIRVRSSSSCCLRPFTTRPPGSAWDLHAGEVREAGPQGLLFELDLRQAAVQVVVVGLEVEHAVSRQVEQDDALLVRLPRGDRLVDG